MTSAPTSPPLGLPTDNNPVAPPQGPASGGRWLRTVGQVVLWVVVVIIGINGLLRIAGVGTGAAPAAPGQEETAPQVPAVEVSAYALRFADVYLEADPEVDRVQALTPFVGEASARSMLAPPGAWEADAVYVAAITSADAHNAVVTLHTTLNGQPVGLDVPVYADETGMAITGAPALVPVDAAGTRPEPARITHDAEAAEALTPTIEGFFGAYATRADDDTDHLARYVEPGADITPLPAGLVELVTVRDVLVPEATGDQPRQVQATVVWEILPPATEEEATDQEDTEESQQGTGPRQVTQVYTLTMARDGSAWYVRAVAGSPTATS